MSVNTVFLNGEYLPLEQAKVSVLDRGFLFADGVYEVIPVYNNCLFRIDEHLKRLQYSLENCRIQCLWDEQQWLTMFRRLIDSNEGSDLSLYLQVTRGTSKQRDHRFDDTMQATVFAMTTPLAQISESLMLSGIKAITMDDIRWARCDIKSTSLLANVLMRQAAEDKGAEEAILLRDGKAIEGSTSNLFIVKANRLITTPCDNQILGGITRQLIVELAAANSLSVQERTIEKNELFDADEVWLSSSTKEIRAVVSIDDNIVGDGTAGPLFKQMVAWYQGFKKTYGQDSK